MIDGVHRLLLFHQSAIGLMVKLMVDGAVDCLLAVVSSAGYMGWMDGDCVMGEMRLILIRCVVTPAKSSWTD